MKRSDLIQKKILSLADLLRVAAQWRAKGKTIVFTNGVFDILHPGHVYSLSQAAVEGDCLVIGMNSDASVKRLKGDARPIHPQDQRAEVLAALVMVDAVVIFEEDTPLELIKALMPDTMVKGGDYTIEQIAGSKEVIANGGRVVINPLLKGISTTGIIGRLQES